MKRYDKVISRDMWSSGWHGVIHDFKGKLALVGWNDKTAGVSWIDIDKLEKVDHETNSGPDTAVTGEDRRQPAAS